MTPHPVVMTQYVVYRDAKDWPWKYVVRAWHVIKGRLDAVPEKEIWGFADNDAGLEALRTRLHEMGLYCIPRYEPDDPVILEIWI